MSADSKPKTVSRRTFIKGMGVGLAGSYVLPSTLNAHPEEAVEASQKKMFLSLAVNNKKVQVEIEPRMTLAELLRDQLHLTGTKIVCNQGECGGCTVLLDGKTVYACHMLAFDAADKEVVTIEGLLSGEKLHPVQEAFIERDGLQCGFCTTGQIMSAYALLNRHPKPTHEQILEGMAGNICRCSAYPKIVESVFAAAEKAGGLTSK